MTKSYIIATPTGFCWYFWTGIGFSSLAREAEEWPTREVAENELARMKKSVPVTVTWSYSGCEIQERVAL